MTHKFVMRALAGLSVALAAFGSGQLPAAGASSPATTGGWSADPVATAATTAPAASRVIVQQWDAADPGPRQAVAALGGAVTRTLPIVNGFAATVPSGTADRLARVPGVRAVSPDSEVRVQADVPAAAGSDAAARPSVYRATVGADHVAAGGIDGSGVVVALIDTGVADVGDLDGRTVQIDGGLVGTDRACVNLSAEEHCGDSYGHGTFMAGLIAGSGQASGGARAGVAPGASILSVKIAGRDGAADVSTVLAAIQWVVAYQDLYGIDVLNLSLGTDSTRSYRSDPLNYAVQKAWDAGVAVIVAASNRGPKPGTVGKPGDDPLAITVGAIDDQATSVTSDDTLPDFSSRGPTAGDGLAKPDLVAPGARVTSLRAPGSLIDEQTGGGGTYLRGSGTSMATAVVSGVAALTLDAVPSMRPDRLKFALKDTARLVASKDPNAVGAGVPSARAAAAAPAGAANQGVERASNVDLGDPVALDLSRGSVTVAVDPAEPLAHGAQTVTQLLADPLWLTGLWTPEAWGRTAWQLNNLLRVRWSGTEWRGKNWQGATFYGQHQPTRAYGQTVPGSAWLGVFGE